MTSTTVVTTKRMVAKRGRQTRKKKAYLTKAIKGQGRNREYNVKFRMQLPYVENGSSVVTGNPADIPFHFAVLANTLPNWAGYSRIYQQYRLVAVKFEFLPSVGNRIVENIGTTSTPVEQFRPLVVTYVNRAATNFIQNVNQGISVPYARVTTAGQKITRYFKLATYDQVYRTSTSLTNAQNVEYGQWLPTSTASDVVHEGLDMVIGAATAIPDGFYKYRPIITVYAQFKGRQMVAALGP